MNLGDIAPNMGVFWYFFTHMFPPFRPFFLAVLHGHVLAYVVPLVVTFRQWPLFTMSVALALVVLFQVIQLPVTRPCDLSHWHVLSLSLQWVIWRFRFHFSWGMLTSSAPVRLRYVTTLNKALFVCVMVCAETRPLLPVLWTCTISSCVAVLMWYLWIVVGAGNANFFYFQSIILVGCVSFGILEAVASARRLQAVINTAFGCSHCQANS